MATPLLVQHQAQVKLREENQLLRHQVERLGPLEKQNELLSNALAQQGAKQSLGGDQLRELLRLRGEVGSLRAAAKELAQLKQTGASGDKQDALKQKDREARLKELLRQRSDLAIPEISMLGEEELAGVASGNDLDSQEGIRAAFGALRFRAVNSFAALLQPALQAYTEANNGQPPGDVLQLAPYFDPPVDDTILQRYTVVQANAVMGGWTGGWAITQKQLVDASDYPWFVSPVGFSPTASSTNGLVQGP
jgi:hypothetical protein